MRGGGGGTGGSFITLLLLTFLLFLHIRPSHTSEWGKFIWRVGRESRRLENHGHQIPLSPSFFHLWRFRRGR